MAKLTDKDIIEYFHPELFEEETDEDFYWLNEKQVAFKQAKQRVKEWVGGYGSGKTHMEADHINEAADSMPASKGLIYGMDYTQLFTQEMPEIFSVMARWGMTEWSQNNPMGDYVIGQRPPKGWKRVHKYKDYSNVISFPDGSVWQLMSGRTGSSVKGGSFDYGVIVEATDCPRDHFFDKVYSRVRGPKGKYDSPYYLSWGIFANMPWTLDGYWVFEFEELAKEEPEEYFYIESDIYDNLPLYGAEYIEQRKKEIMRVSPLIWEVSYMNIKKLKLDNPFYPKLDDKVHFYREKDNIDPHYDYLKPLAVSCDFNNALNSMTVWNDCTAINLFYTEGSEDYEQLARDFCAYYQHRHFNKVIELDGDNTAHYVYDDDGLSRYQGLKKEFEKHGWQVVMLTHPGDKNPDHYEKQRFMYRLLGGELEYELKINREKCYDLYISMVNTPMKRGYKKDKSSEVKLKGKDRKKATDFGDTADYRLWRFVKSRQVNGGGGRGSGMDVDVM